MPFTLDSAFKLQSIGIAFELLTERPGGLYATENQRRNRFRKHQHHAEYQDDPLFQRFVCSDEFQFFFNSLVALLWKTENETNASIIRGGADDSKRLCQEWHADNQELVDETRDTMNDFILISFQVAWSMPGGLDDEAIIDVFNEDEDIVDAWERNKLLFDAFLGDSQIQHIYAAIRMTNTGNPIGDHMNRTRILSEVEAGYRQKIVRGYYRLQPTETVPVRRRRILDRRAEASDDVTAALKSIETATIVSVICDVLRINTKHMQVCEAAFRRLDIIQLLGEYMQPQEWLRAMVATDAVELILRALARHSENATIQENGLSLLRKCRGNALTTRLASTRGIETSICAMLANVRGECGIQKWGLEIILAIDKRSRKSDSLDEFYSNIINANVLLPLTMTLLDYHSGEFSIVERAMIILGNILGGDNDTSNHDAIHANHDAICSFVRAHPGIVTFVNDRPDIVSVLKAAYNVQKDCDKERTKKHLRPLARRVYHLVNLVDKLNL